MTYEEDDLRSALKLLEQRTPEGLTSTSIALSNRRRGWQHGRRSLTPLLAAAAVAGVVAGSIAIASSVGGRHHGPDNPATQSSSPEPAEPFTFPLDAYRPSASELDTLYDAQYKLANACIHSHGLSGSLPTDVHQGSQFDRYYISNIRPISRADAERFGYNLPSTPSTGSDSSLQRLSATPEAQACIAAADRQLMGRSEAANPTGGLLSADLDYVINELTESSRSRAEADPTLAIKNQAWATCMAQHGYPGFHAPINAIEAASLGAVVPPEERRQAIQDVECKDNVMLTKSWAARIRQYQTAVVEQNRSRLTQIQARLTATLQRARSVLAR